MSRKAHSSPVSPGTTQPHTHTQYGFLRHAAGDMCTLRSNSDLSKNPFLISNAYLPLEASLCRRGICYNTHFSIALSPNERETSYFQSSVHWCFACSCVIRRRLCNLLCAFMCLQVSSQSEFNPPGRCESFTSNTISLLFVIWTLVCSSFQRCLSYLHYAHTILSVTTGYGVSEEQRNERGAPQG